MTDQVSQIKTVINHYALVLHNFHSLNLIE